MEDQIFILRVKNNNFYINDDEFIKTLIEKFDVKDHDWHYKESYNEVMSFILSKLSK